MDLKEYFETNTGLSILTTADSNGVVNSALYSKPYFLDGNIAFIMRHRRTYTNLLANPHACYLFIESGDGYKGTRLYLTRLGEDDNPELIEKIKRGGHERPADQEPQKRSIVYFRIDNIRPLVDNK